MSGIFKEKNQITTQSQNQCYDKISNKNITLHAIPVVSLYLSLLFPNVKIDWNSRGHIISDI